MPTAIDIINGLRSNSVLQQSAIVNDDGNKSHPDGTIFALRPDGKRVIISFSQRVALGCPTLNHLDIMADGEPTVTAIQFGDQPPDISVYGHSIGTVRGEQAADLLRARLSEIPTLRPDRSSAKRAVKLRNEQLGKATPPGVLAGNTRRYKLLTDK